MEKEMTKEDIVANSNYDSFKNSFYDEDSKEQTEHIGLLDEVLLNDSRFNQGIVFYPVVHANKFGEPDGLSGDPVAVDISKPFTVLAIGNGGCLLEQSGLYGWRGKMEIHRLFRS